MITQLLNQHFLSTRHQRSWASSSCYPAAGCFALCCVVNVEGTLKEHRACFQISHSESTRHLLLLCESLGLTCKRWCTFSTVEPSSRPTRTVLSTNSAILGSATFRESWTRSVTSTCQSGPSMVMTWSVPSVDVVWNWVSTLTRARWYCRVQPRLTRRSSSSSSASLSLVILGQRENGRYTVSGVEN